MPCRSSPKRLFVPVIGSSSSSNASSRLRPGLQCTSAAPAASAPYHNMSDCVKTPSTRARYCRASSASCNERARAPPRGSAPGRGEIEPGGFAVAPQIETFRIDAGHPPARRRRGRADRARNAAMASAWSSFMCRRISGSAAAKRTIVVAQTGDRAPSIQSMRPKPGDQMPALERRPDRDRKSAKLRRRRRSPDGAPQSEPRRRGIVDRLRPARSGSGEVR